MTRAVRLASFACTLLLAFAAATTAVAAPVPWASMDVTFIEDQGQTVLLVAGQLPETAKLPAQVELSLPAGSQLQWAGELMGDDGTGDFEVEYTTRTVKGQDVYSMTLTKSRTAQVEATIPAITQFDGKRYLVTASWTPLTAVQSARISMRIPSNAQITSTGASETATLHPADAQWSYFSKTVENIKAGTQQTLAFGYELTAASPAASGGSGSNSAIPVLLIGLAVIGFGIAFMAIRRKAEPMQFNTSDDDEDWDEDEAAEEPAETDDGDEDDHDEADSADDEDAEGDVEDEAPAVRRIKPSTMVLLGVIVVAVIVGVAAGSRSTNAVQVDGGLTRSYGTADACTKASIAIAPVGGAQLSDQADTIFTALEQVPGIGDATILPEQGVIEVGYCDSSATEDDIRGVLAATGVVEVAAASGAPAGGTPSNGASTTAD